MSGIGDAATRRQAVVPDEVTDPGHGRDGEHRSAREAQRVPRFGHGSRVPGWDDEVDLEKDPIEVPDLATTPVGDELRAEIEAHMAKYPDPRSAALPALAAAQRRHGWCSPQAIQQVAAVMRLTPAYLSAIATFYDMFHTEPVGLHRVYVCTNISCSLNGADPLYERLCEAADGTAALHVQHFECLGACDIAPMASVDGVYVGPLDLDDVPALLDDLAHERPPLPDKQLRRRFSTDPGANSERFEPGPGNQPIRAAGVGGTPKAPLAFGPDMPADEDRTDQPAPVEQAPDQPKDPEPDA
ncbi:MAG TPA: NAD(P)H-dependent oxidoreductase subunit E [Solirubrobacteraceae bacterium]|nr:NAD(P)H-dependent oxidoreductase subunit E [Solirubrobacteraceae bacterium]